MALNTLTLTLTLLMYLVSQPEDVVVDLLIVCIATVKRGDNFTSVDKFYLPTTTPNIPVVEITVDIM